MVTDLRPTDDAWSAGDEGRARPWEEPWASAEAGEPTAARLADLPPPPAWETATAAPSSPTFSRVRRGYDTEQVDRHLASLERRLVDAESLARTPVVTPDTSRHAAAVEVGTVLLDAREAAERIRADAEVAAARLVADAEREARQVLDEGRQRVDHEADRRHAELVDDLRVAEEAAAHVRDATTHALSQISEWRSAALSALERVVAALEQWPGTVPDPVSLEDVLGPARPDHGDEP